MAVVIEGNMLPQTRQPLVAGYTHVVYILPWNLIHCRDSCSIRHRLSGLATLRFSPWLSTQTRDTSCLINKTTPRHTPGVFKNTPVRRPCRSRRLPPEPRVNLAGWVDQRDSPERDQQVIVAERARLLEVLVVQERQQVEDVARRRAGAEGLGERREAGVLHPVGGVQRWPLVEQLMAMLLRVDIGQEHGSVIRALGKGVMPVILV